MDSSLAKDAFTSLSAGGCPWGLAVLCSAADQLLTSIQRLAAQKLEGATVTVELVDQRQLELWPTGKHRFVVRLAGSGEDSVARA